MVEIVPYTSVNGVPFGSEESAVLAALGKPDHVWENREGSLSLEYPEYIVHLEANTKVFREITMLPECKAVVKDVAIEWNPEFLGVVQEEDPDLVMFMEDVISLRLGLVFVGFLSDESKTIHAFRKGGLDELRGEMKPFHFSP